MTDIVIASAARTRRGAASQNKAKEMLGRRQAGQPGEFSGGPAMHAQPSVAEQPKGEGQTADKGC